MRPFVDRLGRDLLELACAGGLLFVILLAGDVAARDASTVTAVVVLQVLAGASIWRRCVRTDCSALERLGMGFVVGSIVSTLGGLLGVTLNTRLGPLLPIAVAAALALASWIRSRRTARDRGHPSPAPVALREPAVEQLITIAPALLLGLVAHLPFWRAHPLTWTGWTRPHVDMGFHMALCSVAWAGTGSHPGLADAGLRYHYFSHAWMGGVAEAAEVHPSVLVLRVVGPCALLAGVALVAELARLLDRGRRRAAVWASLLFVCGARLFMSDPGLPLSPLSPSTVLATPWLLGLSLCVYRLLTNTLAAGPAWTLLLVAALVGCKGSHGAIAVPGLLGAVVGALVIGGPRTRRRALAGFGTGVVGFLVAYVSTNSGRPNDLGLGWGQLVADAGLPISLGWAPLATLAFLVLATGRDVGALCVRDTTTHQRLMICMASGSFLTALGLALVLTHAGRSQLYFLAAAHVIVCPIAGWGLAAAARRTPPQALIASALLAVATVALAGALLDDERRALPAILGLDRPARRLGVAALLVLLPLVGAIRGTIRSVGQVAGADLRRAIRDRAALALSLASITVGLLELRLEYRGLGATTPWAPDAVSEQHLEAARWVAANTERECLFATNRLHAAGRARRFFVSGYAGRRVLVEGPTYAVFSSSLGAELPAWLDRQVALSLQLSEPTNAPAAMAALAAEGVCYVWLEADSSTSAAPTPPPRARVAFSNGQVTLLDLVGNHHHATLAGRR